MGAKRSKNLLVNMYIYLQESNATFQVRKPIHLILNPFINNFTFSNTLKQFVNEFISLKTFDLTDINWFINTVEPTLL